MYFYIFQDGICKYFFFLFVAYQITNKQNIYLQYFVFFIPCFLFLAIVPCISFWIGTIYFAFFFFRNGDLSSTAKQTVRAVYYVVIYNFLKADKERPS